MKFLIFLVTVFSMAAWSQINEADPNLKIGMNTSFEASINAPAYPGVETQVLGAPTSATCPECADPSQLPDLTAFRRDSTATDANENADGQQ